MVVGGRLEIPQILLSKPARDDTVSLLPGGEGVGSSEGLDLLGQRPQEGIPLGLVIHVMDPGDHLPEGSEVCVKVA